MKPVAYEGTEPYIFVSYAHRDSERVFEVLNELQDQGYRFWYDDGIAPGSEWPEDIARHLDAAAMVMAFITPNSMKSQNCRREINFSLSREKPFLSVLLEQTDMPLGMQMQLSAQQSILRYNFDSWGGFIKKILACPDIAPCKAPAQPEPQTVPLPAREPQAEVVTQVAQVVTAVPQAPAPLVGVDEEYHEVEVVPAAEEEAPAAPKRVLPKLGKKDKGQAAARKAAQQKPAGKAGKKLPLPLIAGAVVLLLVAVFAVRALTGGFTTSWGEKVDKGDTSLIVSGQTLTQDDLQKIAGMKKLARLELKDCDLTGCDEQAVTFASKNLTDIDLSGSTLNGEGLALNGLTPKHLNLSGVAAIKTLGSVDTSDLRTLDVSGTGVTDLSEVLADSLYELRFADTAVEDLSPLASLAGLKQVDGSRTKVTSLEALTGLESLEELTFDGCKLGALTTPFAALKLKEVSLADAGVTGLKGLASCTVLKSLNLAGNKGIVSMSWLDAQNYATLQTLDLSRTGLGKDDLAWVGECTGLRTLTLDEIALGDLSLCANLAGLERLSAINCQLTDISGLSGCTNLLLVELAANQITDVSPLTGLSSNGRVTLDLTANALTSVAALPVRAYRAIVLYGNAADDVAATLAEGIDSFEVVTSYFEGIEDSILKGLNGTKTYVVDCPQNQVLNLQDAFGSRLVLVSEEELLDLYANDSFAYPLGIGGSNPTGVTDGGLLAAEALQNAPTFGIAYGDGD